MYRLSISGIKDPRGRSILVTNHILRLDPYLDPNFHCTIEANRNRMENYYQLVASTMGDILQSWEMFDLPRSLTDALFGLVPIFNPTSGSIPGACLSLIWRGRSNISHRGHREATASYRWKYSRPNTKL